MKYALRFVILMIVAGAHAEEASITLHSTVSGSQEQPRVMYIVPWQRPAAAEFDYELENTVAEELFAPVDRDEFVRGLVYEHMLDNQQGAAASGAVETNN